jgi:pimeloyl-ACP methyl ester carboxylesterase
VSATASDEGFAPLPDGGRLAYACHGEGAGPPLLLLRPLGGSMALWGSFRDALAAHVRTISFDPRGVARSSPAPRGTSTRGMARDTLALLDHLRVERADVFGISLGGMVASWLAIDHPARVHGLILASTVARGLDVSGSGLSRGASLAACLLRPARAAEACLVRRVLSARFRRDHPREVERFAAIAEATPASRRELLRHAKAAARHDARADLHRITAPTLLLYGDDDPLIDRAGRRDLERHLPRALVDHLPRAGHDLTLEAPIETAEAIRAFLAR